MSQIKIKVASSFEDIVHKKELDHNNILTLIEGEDRVRFCANCCQMIKETVKELEEHCKNVHEGQNLGFLVWGKEAKRPMFTNFGEWLANKGVDLITVPGYLFKKVEGVPIDSETGGLYRDDQ